MKIKYTFQAAPADAITGARISDLTGVKPGKLSPFAKTKTVGGKKRRFLCGIMSGTAWDAHGERMSMDCLKGFVRQWQERELHFSDIHSRGHSDFVAISGPDQGTECRILDDGNMYIEAHLLEEGEPGVQPYQWQHANTIWNMANGLPPAKTRVPLGLSIEGFASQEDIIESEEGPIINSLELEAVAIVRNPAYEPAMVTPVLKSKDLKKKADLIANDPRAIRRELEESIWDYQAGFESATYQLLEASRTPDEKEQLFDNLLKIYGERLAAIFGKHEWAIPDRDANAFDSTAVVVAEKENTMKLSAKELSDKKKAAIALLEKVKAGKVKTKPVPKKKEVAPELAQSLMSLFDMMGQQQAVLSTIMTGLGLGGTAEPPTDMEPPAEEMELEELVDEVLAGEVLAADGEEESEDDEEEKSLETLLQLALEGDATLGVDELEEATQLPEQPDGPVDTDTFKELEKKIAALKKSVIAERAEKKKERVAAVSSGYQKLLKHVEELEHERGELKKENEIFKGYVAEDLTMKRRRRSEPDDEFSAAADNDPWFAKRQAENRVGLNGSGGPSGLLRAIAAINQGAER